MADKNTKRIILVDIKTALKVNATHLKTLKLAKKTIIENLDEISRSLKVCYGLNTALTQSDIAKFENTKSYYLSRIFYIETMLLTHQSISSVNLILLNRINKEADKLIYALCDDYTKISTIYTLTIKEITKKHK